MTSIAIIPARGGSKRIPRKNIKDFLGKPIIAYSINAAVKSGLFTDVMVSTDDDEIAAIAKEYGASVPFMRSEKNSTDHANTMDVIFEVLDMYKDSGSTFDHACCIYPTAPLTQVEDIRKGFDLLNSKGLACVFPAVAFSYPIWRGLERSNEEVKMIWPEHVNTRSQDLKTVYHDAGQWYWFKLTDIIEWEWPHHSDFIILPEERVQDIDTNTDWKLAEMKCKLALESK
jgi:N-acylneuraminate cytidylyltransferase